MVKFRHGYVTLAFFNIWILIECDGTFQYDNDTSVALCSSQCSAFCMDNPAKCMDFCKAPIGHWLAQCDTPGCMGACEQLIPNFTGRSDVPTVPDLFISRIFGRQVTVSWSVSYSTYQVLYVLQMRAAGDLWQTIAHGVKDTTHTEAISDICTLYQFRVMAVNQIGSNGFSYPVNVSDIIPGPVANMTIVGGEMFYYPITGEFGGGIQVGTVPGWNSSDIMTYSWSPSKSNCGQSINSHVLPVFDSLDTNEEAGNRHGIGIRIHGDGFGCNYTIQVQAISRCGIRGQWSNVTIDLTDCRSIKTFPCPVNIPFNPPGNVENVSLRADFGHPKIWLKIKWSPPSDLGSVGFIDHYIMRWGKVIEANIFELLSQANFVNHPNQANLRSNIVEFQINVPRQDNATYGFQIAPMAPNKRMSSSSWDLFHIYTIGVGRDGLIDNHLSGSLLMDEDGIKIVQIPNSLNIRLLWRLPRTKRFYDRYAVQYGRVTERPPLVRPTLVNKTVTVVSSVCRNSSKYYDYYQVCTPDSDGITLSLSESDALFGLQIRGIEEDRDLPSDDEWEESPLYYFSLHDPGGNITDNSTGVMDQSTDHNSDLLALYIILPLLIIVIIVLLISRKRQFRKKLSYLHDRVLSPSEDFVNDYNGIQPIFVPILQKTTEVPSVVPDKWEVPHSCVKVGRILGQGAFGKVMKGRISRSVLGHRGVNLPANSELKGTFVSVAVKMLQEDAQTTYREDFLREIKLMKEIGYHTNVVSMLGCCTLREPYCVIVEHVPHGDLLTYLREIRQVLRQRAPLEEHYVNRGVDVLSPTDLMSFARQIAVGMEFLSQKGFIHRDLAARNVLVGYNKTVKIGDFGLTRFVYNDKVYINRKGGKLPLKWMSIEAIFELTFSTASDVWSFGVVLFEIVTLGGTPYPTLDSRDLLRELKRGYRMERPDNCSEELYQLMRSCWQEYPEHRPSFSDLRNTLENMLEESSCLDYFKFSVEGNGIYYPVEQNEERFPHEGTDSGGIQIDEDLVIDCLDGLPCGNSVSEEGKIRPYHAVGHSEINDTDKEDIIVGNKWKVVCDVHVESSPEAEKEIMGYDSGEDETRPSSDVGDSKNSIFYDSKLSTAIADEDDMVCSERRSEHNTCLKMRNHLYIKPNPAYISSVSEPVCIPNCFGNYEKESGIDSRSSSDNSSLFRNDMRTNGSDADESSNNSRRDTDSSSSSIEDEVFLSDSFTCKTVPNSLPFSQRFSKVKATCILNSKPRTNDIWTVDNKALDRCRMCSMHNGRFRSEPEDSGVSTSSNNDDIVYTFQRRFAGVRMSPYPPSCTDTSQWESDEAMLTTYL